MRALTKYAPRHASSLRDWKHISNLTLADDDPTGSTPIDLIIGADLYSKVLVNIRNGPIGQPDAIQSHFGWILSGPTSIPNHVIQNTHVVGSTLVSSHVGAQPQGSPLPSSQQRYHAVAHCCSLERQLCKFWEVEETPQHVHASIEDKQCEDHFQRTHTRTADGRYVVRLPFKEGPPIKIGDSRSIAERRLSSLIRKFARQPTLAQEYLDFMREYEQLNHMKLHCSSRMAQEAPLKLENFRSS
ncbi:uncharacterized protein LOC114942476 [Nylanderia fulva]|uniref:uncharacterized protein LOC114942476 n=1 Tax=Nylanderia fulva TaxID=613905 RepID=UPI0010FB0C41|nr:uncharacterized protein LOC114942476 [Nylanderia fulva]